MIGQYRKRPVVIEASDQVTNENAEPIASWCGGVVVDGAIEIHTLEGTMTATTGDRVIKGVSDEFYPCKPDIFDATYEAEA